MPNNNKRKRNVMSSQVEEAVNDILHGVTVDSSTEWLQREYLRLMRREAKAKQLENESKLRNTQNSIAQPQTSGNNGDGNSVANRPTEQHGEEEHGECVTVDA